jgi:diguanylate cyclase (GGDEF)-like protein
MSQGLCMFDSDGRLLVWNKRYLEIFALETDQLRVGMSQRQIVERLVGLGRYAPDLTVDILCEGTRTSLVQGQATSILRELADGRTVAATHRAMSGGGWVTTFEDVTERRRNEDRITYMARHDALTDLPNRAALHEIGEVMLGQLRPSEFLAVLCLDLDRFKPVNDGFGHATGDKLLRCVAQRLQRQVRAGATVARMGGDEFVVLHRVETLTDAESLARRLIAAVSAPYAFDGLRVEIGMSAGIVLSGRDDGTVIPLLQNADLALYQAKADGRGTYRVFEARMDERARARLSLEQELREALTNNCFEVFYQPLVDLGSNDVIGLEALVRWRHAERGLTSPAVFIPLAEETGLIVPLGEWVLRRACRDAARWPRHVRVAVNVSPHQLRQRNFTAMVISALSESGLDPKRLELEITESVLLEETDANLKTLHALRSFGVRIAMDDFGTGYSSISYLRRFPFDKIKIDRSFVREIGEKPEASAIIRAIIGLGRSLNMTTLVEGIETEVQRSAVQAEGAHEMQGFLFSSPRPAQEIDAFFKNGRPENEAA